MRIAITAMTVLALAVGRVYGGDADQPPPTPEQEQPEVLTSGPVHEAFAEPVDLQVQAGLVVPDEPPAKIQEVPPAEKPQGTQFVWVPGYWAWDAGRHGYIWVSACWRAAPPKMYWVPGYWARVPEGWEWVPGFWTPAGNQKIEYLPAPPALENVEPLVSPPSPDDIWAPPCQYWYEGHYILRPGYWVHGQAGWVWVPSHYTWTPRGYVFVAGHWDYSLEHRGVLFAPVYLPRRTYEQPGFSYSLRIVIDIGVLRASLFTYPRYSHYCFGDYYDDAYVRIGIYPRFESENLHIWYDPIYQYDRWQNRRTDPRWEENERQAYDLRRADKSLRPARTYREMEARQAKLPEPQRRSLQMAEPLRTAITHKATPLKFEPVKSSEQKKIARQATDVHKFREQRDRWESSAASHKAIQPLSEPKAAMTPVPERKEPASVERKSTAGGPVERKEPASAPVERKSTPTGPVERKEPAPASVERKSPVTAPTVSRPAEGKDSATARTERTSPLVSPRELKVTKPETVKIPKPPIVGKAATENKREVSPPPKPVQERQSLRDTRAKDTDNKKSNKSR